MLFNRHKHLLALVDALGGEVGHLDFQKLLLLYCQEVGTASEYEFVPYKFGGFSFTSHADKRRMVRQGLLMDAEQVWKLTPKGKAAASIPSLVRMRMDNFVKHHAALRGDDLVAESYRRHPYYAINSQMTRRILAGDSLAQLAIEAARPATGLPGLCTIGYEGRSLENYLNELLRDGVTLLCDVRRNPLSRKYGFSKGTLSNACEGVGIRYEHLPQLGIVSEKRRELHTQADYDDLFTEYERDSLPGQHETLAEIRAWIEAGERVALTCFERLPEQCHRHCVAEAMEQLQGSTTTHL